MEDTKKNSLMVRDTKTTSTKVLIDVVEYMLSKFPSHMTFFDTKKKNDIANQWINHFGAFSIEEMYLAIDYGAIAWDKPPSISEIITALRNVRSQKEEKGVKKVLKTGSFMSLEEYLKSIGIKNTKKAIQSVLNPPTVDEFGLKPMKGVPKFFEKVCGHLESVNVFKATKFIKENYKGIAPEPLSLLIETKLSDVLAEMNFKEECAIGKCRGFHLHFFLENGVWYTIGAPCRMAKR